MNADELKVKLEELGDEGYLTINDIEGVHNEIGIRKAIREGKLVTHMEPIKEGSKINHRVFTVEAYKNWRAGVGNNKGNRADGRNKYLLYVNDEELKEVMELLKDTEYVSLIRRANIKTDSE